MTVENAMVLPPIEWKFTKLGIEQMMSSACDVCFDYEAVVNVEGVSLCPLCAKHQKVFVL